MVGQERVCCSNGTAETSCWDFGVGLVSRIRAPLLRCLSGWRMVIHQSKIRFNNRSLATFNWSHKVRSVQSVQMLVGVHLKLLLKIGELLVAEVTSPVEQITSIQSLLHLGYLAPRMADIWDAPESPEYQEWSIWINHVCRANKYRCEKKNRPFLDVS